MHRQDADITVQEEELELHRQTQAVITRMLQDALEPGSLSEHLQEALFLILAIPWISLESKGSIFLYDEKDGRLHLAVQEGLDATPVLSLCAELEIGYCLCGQAAKSRQLVYSSSIQDANHTRQYDGIHDHGHYCVPILYSDRLLGVLNLYVASNHQRKDSEEVFLRAVASTLAGIIVRIQQEEELQRLNTSLERANRFIRSTFGRYMSEEVVESLLDTPEGLKLGGEEKVVTVMMSDLRGFTAIGERLKADEVITLLNIYLEVMAEIILDFKGTIIEFLGDGILALFGAPYTREDDAERAVACALRLQDIMPAVNARLEHRGLPEVAMGIGIDTGPVVVGNIGSDRRSKYGVVGRTINLAARIESQTVGGELLISENTLNAITPEVRIDESWLVDLKGVPEPVRLYEVGGIEGAYHVQLPRPQTVKMQPLADPCDVNLRIVEDKRALKQHHQGRIVALKLPNLQLEIALDLPRLSNVELTIIDSPRIKPLYAKVMKSRGSRLDLHVTALSPEAEALFNAMR